MNVLGYASAIYYTVAYMVVSAAVFFVVIKVAAEGYADFCRQHGQKVGVVPVTVYDVWVIDDDQ
jgi:hypothetical protein